MGTGHRFALAVLAVLLPVTACSSESPEDRGLCSVSGVWTQIRVPLPKRADLLFVVDSSPSMDDEQTRLAEQLPRLARAVLGGELVDTRTGERRRFPTVDDLHVGVVTTDLGCSATAAGDRGVLRRSGHEGPECETSYPPFVQWTPDDRTDPAATQISCVARVGDAGCGIEQPLAATLEALAPEEPEANAGFLRERSLLSVVVITDEDDCSIRDPASFRELDAPSPSIDDPSCHQQPDALQPLDRLLSRLLALRPDNPDRVLVSLVGGFPPDGIEDPLSWNADSVLADPRMQFRAREEATDRLRPACTSSDGATAFPSRRLVRLADALERNNANAALTSICAPDWSRALLPMARKIAEVIGGTCLPRALHVGDSGRVGCRVVETLPREGPVTSCEDLPGREPFPGAGAVPGRSGEQCLVRQVVPDRDSGTVPDEPGWYYDDFSSKTRERCGDDGRLVRYTGGTEAAPVPGTSIALQCLDLQPLAAPEGPGIGGPCDGETNCPDAPPMPGALFCHYGTCQRYCESDADCPPQQGCLERRGVEPSICGHPLCGRGGSAGRGAVGRACEPRRVPPGGFNREEAYAETGHRGCGGGACVVYRLGGDPRNLVSEGCPRGMHDCVSDDQVTRQVTCSCRCNGPAGTGPFCACPEGTQCMPVVGGDPDYAASYCVSIEALCCIGRLDGPRCEDVSC